MTLPEQIDGSNAGQVSKSLLVVPGPIMRQVLS